MKIQLVSRSFLADLPSRRCRVRRGRRPRGIALALGLSVGLSFDLLAGGPALAQAAEESGASPGKATAPHGATVYGPASQAEVAELAKQGDVAALREALAGVRAELDAVKAAAEAERKADEARAAAEVRDQALLTATTAKVKEIESTAQAPRMGISLPGLWLTGFAHIDYTNRQSSSDEVNGSTGDPLNENRFTLRRSRLRLNAERGYVSGVFELDANTVRGAQVRPLTMEVSVRYPAGSSPSDLPLIAATIGVFKIPFGHEVLQSDTARLFAERSTVIRALFAGDYDLGARLSGGWRFLRYAVAIQNGEPLGERTLPGRDPNDAKDVSGRVGVTWENAHPFAFAAGASALVGKGFRKGTPATKPSVFWQDRNENGVFDVGELQVSPGAAAQASSNFKRHAFGLDGRLGFDIPRLGRLMIGGEIVWGKNLDRAILIADPVASGRDLRELGFSGFLLQELGEPLEIGFRFDSYDPDRDSAEMQQAAVVPVSSIYRTWAFAAAWKSKAGRLIVEYDVNRNHNGRDAAGLPANLADNVFTLRGEVKF